MTTYYVSATGNDASSGRSPLLPWQTLAKVRAKMTDGTITRRDVVLFRRGDTFAGRLNGIPTAGLSPRRLIFGTYGDKPEPATLDGYKYANSEAGWTLHAAGIWKCDLTGGGSSSGAYTGDTGAPSTDVGFIKVDGVIHGVKRWAQGELANQWDFYTPEGADPHVYVKSSANPASLADEIALAVDGPLFSAASSVTTSGLRFKGGGGHGGFFDAVGSVRMFDTEFVEIGGSRLGATGTLRYGNGVEIGLGCSDIRGDIYCEDVYDVAFTIQGEQAGANLGTSDVDIHLRDKNCTQSIEYWVRGANTTDPTAGLRNVRVTGYSLNPGHSWAHLVRGDTGRGVAVLLYTSELPYVNVVHEDRDIVNPKDAYSYISHTGSLPPAGFISRRNRIHLAPGQKMQWQRSEVATSFAEWQAATGLEEDSLLYRLPANPVSLREAVTDIASGVGFAQSQKFVLDELLGRVKSDLASGLGQLVTTMDSTWARQAIINCLATPKSTIGFTNVTPNTAYWDGGIRDNGAGAVNDEVVFDVAFQRGTYTLDLFHRTGTDRGIYTVQIDGVQVATVDGYAASAVNVVGTVAGISVQDDGVHTVKLKMASKHASSTAYKGAVTKLILSRTGEPT